jgi:tripartite-type tricarboxylate transporter receptor subunit TctC
VIAGRRGVLAGLSLTAALPLMAAGGRAGSPNRPKRRVTMLLGAAEGSGPDKVARVFTRYLAPHLPNLELAVRNLPGEAGRTMLAALGEAAADGATIGWVSTPTLPARIIDRGDASLGQRIQMIGQAEREPVAFVSPSAEPANTIQDIIQRAGSDADAVPLGTPPAGSAPHLAAVRLQVLAQTRLNIVTFPSAAAAHQAVLASNVSVAALGLSDVIGDLRDGTLAAVGIAAKRRFGLLPNIPVLDEGGIQLAAVIRRGIAVPAGAPAEFIAGLADAMRAVTAEDDFRDEAETSGYYAAWEDGAAWFARTQAEQAVLAKLWETDPWLSSSGG